MIDASTKAVPIFLNVGSRGKPNHVLAPGHITAGQSTVSCMRHAVCSFIDGLSSVGKLDKTWPASYLSSRAKVRRAAISLLPWKAPICPPCRLSRIGNLEVSCG